MRTRVNLKSSRLGKQRDSENKNNQRQNCRAGKVTVCVCKVHTRRRMTDRLFHPSRHQTEATERRKQKKKVKDPSRSRLVGTRNKNARTHKILIKEKGWIDTLRTSGKKKKKKDKNFRSRKKKRKRAGTRWKKFWYWNKRFG